MIKVIASHTKYSRIYWFLELSNRWEPNISNEMPFYSGQCHRHWYQIQSTDRTNESVICNLGKKFVIQEIGQMNRWPTICFHQLACKWKSVNKHPVWRNLHGATLEFFDHERYIKPTSIVSNPYYWSSVHLAAPNVLQ